jgi:hypothetical protein
MADQMRRREKLRKREMLQWRKEWSGHLAMEGPSEQSVAEPALAAPAHEQAPDREARQASKAAAQAAREAANLLGAQVVVAPSDHEDHDRSRHRFSAGGAAASAGAGPGIRSAHAGSPRKESLQPGETDLSMSPGLPSCFVSKLPFKGAYRGGICGFAFCRAAAVSWIR